MKLLTVQPGASYSTSDVHDGLVRELDMLGHDIVRYSLDARIARAGSWLHWNWEKSKEEGLELPPPSPADIIYLASSESILMALRHMPDWVVVISGMYFHPDAFIMLRRARQRVALILTESPYDDSEQFKVLPYADVVFTNDKYTAEDFSAYHRECHYLPHGYDPAKHFARVSAEYDAEAPAHDVVFVGTGFRERIQLLASIDWTGIDLGLYGTYELLEDMPDEAVKLKPFIRAEVVDNSLAASLYRKAKIGLNMHRTSRGFGVDAPTVERAYSLNPRLYELAANGCFIVSDHRPAMNDVFGDLIPTFADAAEAEQLIRRWLADDQGRKAVSSRLPSAVSSHTYTARAVQVARVLKAQGDATWPDITDGKGASTSRRREPAPLAPSSRSTRGR